MGWTLATIHLKDCGLSDVRQSFGSFEVELRQRDLLEKKFVRSRTFCSENRKQR